ncbi:TolC family protein [Planctomycetota bacterium]
MLLFAEMALRHLVKVIENAYWELHFFYRNLDAAKVGRDSALLTWRAVQAQYEEGSGQQADAASIAQSQEQYFFFRGRVEEAKRDLMKAERQLRFLCGLHAIDHRMIRPIDEPDHSKINTEWDLIKQTTLHNSAEANQQRRLIRSITKTLATSTSPAERAELEVLLKTHRQKLEDIELELTHSLTDAVQNVDSSRMLVETSAMQSLSAKKQVDALRAQFREGTVTLDFLMDAERRLADARVAYCRSLTQYEIAKLEVALRSQSLLSDRKLTIHEPTTN